MLELELQIWEKQNSHLFGPFLPRKFGNIVGLQKLKLIFFWEISSCGFNLLLIGLKCNQKESQSQSYKAKFEVSFTEIDVTEWILKQFINLAPASKEER